MPDQPPGPPAAHPAPALQQARRLTPVPFLVILLFGGFANTLQARANGELTIHLGNGVQAALYSFGSGLALLTVLVLTRPGVRAGLGRIRAALQARQLAWWAVPTGIVGGVFIGLQSYSTAILGVALFSVGMVAGQTANSLVVDRWGLGPIGRAPITGRRLLSAVIAVAAVTVAASGRFGDAGFSTVAMIAAFVGGCLVAIQQALNGRVNVAARQPIATTWVNFCFGTATLLVGALLGVLLFDASVQAPTTGPWWMWLGGLFGLSFIATASWAVPRYGVLLFALVTIAGQLTSALVIDLIAPVAGSSWRPTLLVGVLLTYAAVVIGARRTR